MLDDEEEDEEDEEEEEEDAEDISYGCDRGPILFLSMRLIELTEGTLYLSQILSCRSLSRISHAKMPGSRCL